ncbi:MAG: hypothetical protein ACTHM1_07405 [Solirubrobacteraceae bacterium]
MKSLPALLAFGLLVLWTAACGSSKSNTASPSNVSSAVTTQVKPTNGAVPSSPTSGFVASNASARDRERHDRDEDDHTTVPDDHNPAPAGYVTASAADAKAITALVKGYFAAALSEDGARACSMIDKGLVKAIPLDYGKLGPSYLRHAAPNCPAVMTLYFKHEHRTLSREVPGMRVPRVSVHGGEGIAFLRFGRVHERFISEFRNGSAWKIGAVLDEELE